jgi:chemotaxis protein histidine kinase CheA
MIDKEILTEFQAEAKKLVEELEEILEEMEGCDSYPSQPMERFAQRIDRIMGAAQTLNQLDPDNKGLRLVGALAQICKRMGYQAAQAKEARLLPFFSAFWADTLELVDALVSVVGDAKSTSQIQERYAQALLKRLEWLQSKVASSGASGGAPSSALNQSDVDALAAALKA